MSRAGLYVGRWGRLVSDVFVSVGARGEQRGEEWRRISRGTGLGDEGAKRLRSIASRSPFSVDTLLSF